MFDKNSGRHEPAAVDHFLTAIRQLAAVQKPSGTSRKRPSLKNSEPIVKKRFAQLS